MRKDYKGADYIFYLPSDTTANAKQFLDIVNPEIAIFVKYEYWLNLLFELRKRQVKSYVVSAIFRKNSIFFKWWGFMWRSALKSFDTIFVQNNESQKLLGSIGFENVIVAGDTRFDRVATIAKEAKKIPTIVRFKGDNQLLVAGSTWAPDEQMIAELAQIHPDIKIVIAPHEIDEKHIIEIEELLGERATRFTEITHLNEDGIEMTSDLGKAQVLILDTIGMLSSLYQYGDWAYIGGGFGVGIHNTLEAATFGMPIAFGPNYQRFKEAVDMVEIGACKEVNSANDLISWFTPLKNNNALRIDVGCKSRDYTAQKCGATSRILETILD